MTLNDQSRRIFVLLLSLLGTAALFPSFTYNTSPWDAVRLFDWQISLVGAPYFLSIVILIWQARLLKAEHLDTTEIAFAYSISAAAMAATAVTQGSATFNMVSSPLVSNLDIITLTAVWLLLVANVLLLLRNRRARLLPEATAEAFLLGAYLPNAILCLLAFGIPQFERLQVGAYMIAVVVVGYTVAIVLLLREKPGGTPAAIDMSTTKRPSQPPQS